MRTPAVLHVFVYSSIEACTPCKSTEDGCPGDPCRPRGISHRRILHASVGARSRSSATSCGRVRKKPRHQAHASHGSHVGSSMTTCALQCAAQPRCLQQLPRRRAGVLPTRSSAPLQGDARNCRGSSVTTSHGLSSFRVAPYRVHGGLHGHGCHTFPQSPGPCIESLRGPRDRFLGDKGAALLSRQIDVELEMPFGSHVNQQRTW